ncbi:hypothetical protein ADL21_11425 [Streptomyces albus subsp. albus]|nr:hypothetical protein ADL21_11425 [Streptomyces albus subsp. albus]
MTPQTAITWGIAAAAWAGCGYKLIRLRQSPADALQLAVCAALFLAGFSTLSGSPAVIRYLNSVSAVPNLGMLVAFALAVALAGSARVLLAYWLAPQHGSRFPPYAWAFVYAALIAVLVVLFLSGHAPVERVEGFDTYYATTPFIVECILLYLLALASVNVIVVRKCWRWAPAVGRPWLRRGLRLIAIAAVAQIGFCAAKLTAVAARWFGGRWDALDTRLAPALTSIAALFAITGVLLPACGHYLSRAAGWADRRRAYRDLRPLWLALRRADPGIVAPTPLPWWAFGMRLTRRLAEINDGRLALRPYTDSRVAQAAVRLGRDAGLSRAELHAVVVAAQLKAATAAKAAGATFPPSTAADDDVEFGRPDGAGEVAWLRRVARAYTRSPIVATAASPPPLRDDIPARGPRERP